MSQPEPLSKSYSILIVATFMLQRALLKSNAFLQPKLPGIPELLRAGAAGLAEELREGARPPGFPELLLHTTAGPPVRSSCLYRYPATPPGCLASYLQTNWTDHAG